MRFSKTRFKYAIRKGRSTRANDYSPLHIMITFLKIPQSLTDIVGPNNYSANNHSPAWSFPQNTIYKTFHPGKPICIWYILFYLVSFIFLGLIFNSAQAEENISTKLPLVWSADLCADQWVLAFADQAQIVAVSEESLDSRWSYESQRARKQNIHKASLEEIVLTPPHTKLLFGPHQNYLAAQVKRFLKQSTASHDILILSEPNSLQELLDLTEKVGVWMHQPQSSQTLIDQVKFSLAELAKNPVPKNAALVLRPDGGSVGSDTWMDSLFELAATDNQAKKYHLVGWGRLHSEQWMMQPPSLYWLAYFDHETPTSALQLTVKDLPSSHSFISQKQLINSAAVTCPGPGLLKYALEWADCRLHKKCSSVSL